MYLISFFVFGIPYRYLTPYSVETGPMTELKETQGCSVKKLIPTENKIEDGLAVGLFTLPELDTPKKLRLGERTATLWTSENLFMRVL